MINRLRQEQFEDSLQKIQGEAKEGQGEKNFNVLKKAVSKRFLKEITRDFHNEQSVVSLGQKAVKSIMKKKDSSSVNSSVRSVSFCSKKRVKKYNPNKRIYSKKSFAAKMKLEQSPQPPDLDQLA